MFCFNITTKWNLKKSHATRLKSAKYKTHVIKEQLSKLNELHQNESISGFSIQMS